ncbi:MAG: amidohydrolase family protein, partial [Candidatus Thorarchaeota archaeon]
MLIIRALDDDLANGVKKGDIFHLYILDSHHHMGKEKSHRNTPSGAYDFYALLWFEMQRLAKELMNDDKLLFEPVDVRSVGLPGKFFNSRDSWKRMDHGWLVDRTIVFPYTDDYSKSDKKGVPSFKVSNDKIAGWTTRAPHSTRLIGFARIDPLDAKNGPPDIAINELERAINVLGLRGLKLHPIAQLFLDDLEDESTKMVLQKAGDLDIPVIFDTRNIRTVTRIHGLIESMRDDTKFSKSVETLRVIIAHCGMSPGDSKLYDALRDPAIFADTSTLHGQDVPLLFKMAQKRISLDEKSWSQSLLFGTDFSFLSVQAIQVILYLLSRDFSGSLTDIQRVLGGNALSVVGKPFVKPITKKKKPQQISTPYMSGEMRSRIEEKILSSIHQKKWNLSSLDYMIPPTDSWPRLIPEKNGGYNGIHLDSYILAMKSPTGKNNVQIWLDKYVGDIL